MGDKMNEDNCSGSCGSGKNTSGDEKQKLPVQKPAAAVIGRFYNPHEGPEEVEGTAAAAAGPHLAPSGADPAAAAPLHQASSPVVAQRSAATEDPLQAAAAASGDPAAGAAGRRPGPGDQDHHEEQLQLAGGAPVRTSPPPAAASSAGAGPSDGTGLPLVVKKELSSTHQLPQRQLREEPGKKGLPHDSDIDKAGHGVKGAQKKEDKPAAKVLHLHGENMDSGPTSDKDHEDQQNPPSAASKNGDKTSSTTAPASNHATPPSALGGAPTPVDSSSATHPAQPAAGAALSACLDMLAKPKTDRGGGKLRSKKTIPSKRNKGEDAEYEGEVNVEDGRPHGEGKLTWPNGDFFWRMEYEGQFQGGSMDGCGKMVYGNVPMCLPSVRAEPPRLGTYEGQWKNDKREGEGVHTYPDGATYRGQWYLDLQHGEGEYTWPGGSESYKGEYKDGKPHGRGLYTWPTGDTYEGQWEHNQRHGEGVHTWPDRTSWHGEFKEDRVDASIKGKCIPQGDSGLAVDGKSFAECAPKPTNTNLC
ncbi:unnamed protein product [Amoebophrya sp. A120]|nr:unnamed protein product [Amoebophrya sp. A120]|eukprot:GSA120T00024550001.1